MSRKDEPFDPVSKPAGYNSHASGIETVEVTEHLSAMLGSAVKYVWRHMHKGAPIQDLRKAAWCFRREAARLERFAGAQPWNGEYWRGPAEHVEERDHEVLGDVLRTLLAIPIGLKDSAACRRMAERCDEEAARLASARRPCAKCGGSGRLESIHTMDRQPLCDECGGRGGLPLFPS